jgi:hypothetical protein
MRSPLCEGHSRTSSRKSEAAAYIASVRVGLQPSSAQYVSGHLKDGAVPPSVSAEMIVKVAGKLEEMSRHLLPARKSKTA